MSDRNALGISNGNLIVKPRGLDRLWGFRKQIVVPLDRIERVEVELHPRAIRRGLRAPGLDAYWKRSGTFHPGGERHYWNQSGSGPVLVVVIAGGDPFARLYLSVADAESAREMIAEEANLTL